MLLSFYLNKRLLVSTRSLAEEIMRFKHHFLPPFQFGLIWCSMLVRVYSASWQHLRAGERQSFVTLICRVTIEEMFWEDTNDGGIQWQDEDTVVCIQQQQVDDSTGEQGGDSSIILSLAEMPSYVYKNNEKEISIGKLYMSISNVVVQGGKVVMSNDTEFNILEKPGNRNLEEDELPIGEKTLAVIRVSTRDAQVTASSKELRDMVLGEEAGPNIISQYREMSFGQLQFKPLDVFEVFLDANIGTFENGAAISTAVELAMVEQLSLAEASDLADRVFFCVPPGLQKGFIAFTYRNYWRATFSDTWCHSLSATIHEVGHTIGLGHSNLAVEGDNQDGSCYMSIGTGDAHAPRQTFNAHKGWQTGWYASRHLTFNPLAEEIRLIEVAALVDFELASSLQPVIVKIDDDLYMQYNRAKSFNSETRGSPDMLVVVQAYESSNSDVIASLGSADDAFEIADFKGSGQSLSIDVCREEYGKNGTPDIMVVSIGLGDSACSAPDEDEDVFLPPPAPKPSTAPISAPTRSPVQAPSHAPKRSPIQAPLHAPTQNPTHTPNALVREPSSVPSSSTLNSPSHAPSFTSSANPISTPSSTPDSFLSNGPSYHLSPAPSSIPIHAPSSAPSSNPSFSPSFTPSLAPSLSTLPSHRPSQAPSLDPTVSALPSSTPSSSPSTRPSSTPSFRPSMSPTVSQPPSSVPSSMPTSRPTLNPSVSPSEHPTRSSTPTVEPSDRPTSKPSPTPSTSEPTTHPTSLQKSSPPSTTPTSTPSEKPTVKPSAARIISPSQAPTSLSKDRINEILDIFFG
jgi:hypothetical protein